jgi:DNA-binding NtrC family response regulator
VDDDPFVSEMLAEILQSEGCAVETAGNGSEAYNKFMTDPHINIVISDMQMPGMDGLQLIKKLREVGADVPIVILTGNNEISIAVEAMKNGASDYIQKDENIQDTVLPLVKKVLEKHHLKRHNTGDE